MSVDWETFKSNLGCLQNTSVVYVDDEGSEIPIDSDLEFQEALRLAKLKNNHLKLILYDGRTQRNTTIYTASTKCEPEITVINLSEKLLPRLNDEKKSSVLVNSNLKKNICHCNEDAPPEWFIRYMKKFKKELLYELETNLIDIVENTVEKSKKQSNKKSDFVKDFACFNKNLITTTTTTNQPPCSTPAPSKKIKKILEKDSLDSLDLINQRAIKVTKRLENRNDKFEKVDNVRFILQEKKSLDTKSMLKTKPESMDSIVNGVENMVRKPYYFRKHGVLLCLVPGGEFTIDVNVINDGKIGWTAPRLKCFELMGLQVEEPSIELPKLLPDESCVVTIRGRAAKTVGLQHFEFTLVDGEKKIGSQFTCWARVESFEPYEVYCDVWVQSNGPDSISLRTGTGTGSSNDFEMDLIAVSEKKIEKNIMEIEKRLREIDFLRPSAKERMPLKKNGDKPKKLNGEKASSCDLSKNSEDKEQVQDQEEILLGIDCLRLTPESGQNSTEKTKSNKDQYKKDREWETSSDSELSVIGMSEDENFIVVPLPSKSPSPPTQSVSEDKGVSSGESVIKPVASKKQPESVEAKEPLKPDTKTESSEHVNKEVPPKEDSHSGQLSPVRTRRSPFGEEISEFKPKKMKSKSTEYHFTAAHLTQPTFTPIPEGFFGVRPSKFTFTGEEKEKPQGEGKVKGGPSKFTFTAEKEDKSKKKDNFTVRNVPKADALGRIIYAVNVNGYCLPVGDLFSNGERSRSSKEETCRKEEGGSKTKCEKRNDCFNEIPAVNILPNAFMSGASNVASIAFNTAKSVINNLQSAFVTEGKTELGKPACEDKKKLSMEAMFKLYEMGFSDLHLNRELLLKNDNDLLKVVEELVRLQENPSRQPQ